MAKTSFGPNSTANTLRVVDLPPFASGPSFAPCVSYRKGFFQSTYHLVLKRWALLSLHDIAASCLPFLSMYPSRRGGSHAQHLKQHCKLLMLCYFLYLTLKVSTKWEPNMPDTLQAFRRNPSAGNYDDIKQIVISSTELTPLWHYSVFLKGHFKSEFPRPWLWESKTLFHCRLRPSGGV